jgi:hypothetical protein
LLLIAAGILAGTRRLKLPSTVVLVIVGMGLSGATNVSPPLKAALQRRASVVKRLFEVWPIVGCRILVAGSPNLDLGLRFVEEGRDCISDDKINK